MIAHRGNTQGPNPECENHPSYIKEALEKGYHAEVDVWLTDKGLFLGHDEPQWAVDPTFFEFQGLWCHAKNREALEFLIKNGNNCFWHEEDRYTLTSNGTIWAYPGHPAGTTGVQVMPERTKTRPDRTALGICSDYVVLEKLEEICRDP